MRVLIVKTSSLGDVLHTLPAVTDAVAVIPGIRLDWVVEEKLTEIPAWHPAVDRVIPVGIRRWRKSFFSSLTQIGDFGKLLKEREYDAVIDAQGLVKSSLVTVMARGPKWGLDKASIKEPFAARAYDHPVHVPKGTHAIGRVRSLFAQALGYAVPDTPPDAGIDRTRLPPVKERADWVFLHGTAWETKQWPEVYWRDLIALAVESGSVALPWGGEEEEARAERLVADFKERAHVLPAMGLGELASLFTRARGVVAVDTGLGHLAAALGVPAVHLYGPTDPVLTGAVGANQVHLAAAYHCAPCLKRACPEEAVDQLEPLCFTTLPPAQVWASLQAQSQQKAQ